MTRVKLDTPAFADNSVDTRTIKDGTIIAQDVSGSLTNAKLANSSFTINGSSVSLGGSTSIIVYLDWQAVTVADGSTTLTAEAGKGYFLDTNTGVIEVFLPTSPSRGDTIALVDYSGTFATNKLIINTGGKLIDSTTGSEFKVETNNAIVELVYVDAAKGYQVMLNQAAGTTPTVTGNEIGGGYNSETFLEATGGTVTESGNFKVHSFTGDGNFVVSSIGNLSGPGNTVDYLVVAGGGGGGSYQSGVDFGRGGGAGGYRESKSPVAGSYTASPLAATTGITVTAATFPITVGSGGGGRPSPGGPGSNGSNSVFSTITSTGGGGGGSHTTAGQPGGSGGGGSPSPGSGNTPPVSPPQGFPGGNQGGGAGGPGKNGTPSEITGSAVTRAGGGGAVDQPGGTGGGGHYTVPRSVINGVANTGGGGGGGGASGAPGTQGGGTGGKGIVILRYKFQ